MFLHFVIMGNSSHDRNINFTYNVLLAACSAHTNFQIFDRFFSLSITPISPVLIFSWCDVNHTIQSHNRSYHPIYNQQVTHKK